MINTSPWIEAASGVRLFVQDWGQGKPIVFIHGFPFSHRIFDFQAHFLVQQGYRVVALDLRGFGQSDKPWEGYDYDTWAHDVHAIIQALDLRDVTLTGFSMGGGIVVHYAGTLHDPRIAKLALLGAAAPIAAPRPEDKQILEGFIQGLLADQAKFSHDFVQGAFHTPPSPERSRFLEEMGTAAALRAEVRGLEELRDRDLVAEISNIKVPTLICHGLLDQVVPFAAGEAQQHLIPEASLVRFEASGHCLMYEEQEKLATELAKFHAG